MQQLARQKTKIALMRSAERLFAEKGLGSVSVKEITHAAGARNPSAVHYHFGNIETLVKEVFVQRFTRIEADRLQRLSAVDSSGAEAGLVALMEAAMAPFIETCLEEEGRLYVRFCVQLFTDPRFNASEIITQSGAKSIPLLREKVVAHLKDVPEEVLGRRLMQGFMISLLQADDFARRIEAGIAPSAHQAIREAAASLAGYLSAKID